MPVPKKKKPRSAVRSRRAQWKGAVPSVSVCPQCKKPRAPHRACANCGTYAGRQVIQVD